MRTSELAYVVQLDAVMAMSKYAVATLLCFSVLVEPVIHVVAGEIHHRYRGWVSPSAPDQQPAYVDGVYSSSQEVLFI